MRKTPNSEPQTGNDSVHLVRAATERGCPSRSNVRTEDGATEGSKLHNSRCLLRLGQPRSVAADRDALGMKALYELHG